MGVPRHCAGRAITHGELYAAEDLDDPVIEIGEIDVHDPRMRWTATIRIDRLDDAIAVLTEIRRRRAVS